MASKSERQTWKPRHGPSASEPNGTKRRSPAQSISAPSNRAPITAARRGHCHKDQKLPEADSRYCRRAKSADQENVYNGNQPLEKSREEYRQGEIDNPAADRNPLRRVVQEGML